MVNYRCYILDAEDHILQAHELNCDTDMQAESAAEQLLADDPYYRSAEVWRAVRRVKKLDRNATTSLRRGHPPTWQAFGSAN